MKQTIGYVVESDDGQYYGRDIWRGKQPFKNAYIHRRRGAATARRNQLRGGTVKKVQITLLDEETNGPDEVSAG